MHEVRVERRGDRLALRFAYRPATVDAVRQIPGRRWDPDRREWTIPDEEDARAALTRIFGTGLPGGVNGSRALAAAVSAGGRDLLRETARELALRRYSPRSRKAYLGHLRRFLTAATAL